MRRDIHKMKAFVRFRRCVRAGEAWFAAWYRPDHHIERRAAPFFRDRFAQLRWCILTPRASLTWDLSSLFVGSGVEHDAAARADELERLWLTYYASTFNPARVKLKAMRAKMPARHWPTLPETRLIAPLVAQAPERVAQMLRDCGEALGSTQADGATSPHRGWVDACDDSKARARRRAISGQAFSDTGAKR